MGCGCTKVKKSPHSSSIIGNNNTHNKNQREIKENLESTEVKRKKMLEAAEEREKKLKMHGMSEVGYKEYQEKLKKQQSTSKNNYEPLDWNS